MLPAHRERHRRVVMMGGFLPNQIGNLGFWLESDYGITKDGSNAVSEWIDRSPNAYTLTQATGANQPIFTANEFGSKAGLIFDGTNDSLERSVANPFGSVQNYTCFIVCKSQNNNNEENYFSMGDLGTTNSFLLNKGLNTRGNSFYTATIISGGVDLVYGNTAINDNLGKLVICESDGSTWSERINRINQTLTVANGTNSGEAPGDFTTLDNITMGMIRRNATAYARSNYSAILFYTSQISVAARTQVEDYLISKYGIAA